MASLNYTELTAYGREVNAQAAETVDINLFNFSVYMKSKDCISHLKRKIFAFFKCYTLCKLKKFKKMFNLLTLLT